MPVTEFSEQIDLDETADHTQLYEELGVALIKIKSLHAKNTALLIDKLAHQHEAKLGKLATQVAHDLRSPLTALRMLSSKTEFSGDYQFLINQTIVRINDIASDLLGQGRHRMEVVDVEQVFEELIAEHQVQCPEIRFSLNSSLHLEKMAVRPSEFKRAISNILSNAEQAVGADGKIDIKLRREENDLELVIEDNGSGIPESVLSKIFVRGYSTKASTGLGLAYAKDVIEDFNGNISIQSTIGSGTAVKILIPVATASVSRAPFDPVVDAKRSSYL